MPFNLKLSLLELLSLLHVRGPGLGKWTRRRVPRAASSQGLGSPYLAEKFLISLSAQVPGASC